MGNPNSATGRIKQRWVESGFRTEAAPPLGWFPLHTWNCDATWDVCHVLEGSKIESDICFDATTFLSLARNRAMVYVPAVGCLYLPCVASTGNVEGDHDAPWQSFAQLAAENVALADKVLDISASNWKILKTAALAQEKARLQTVAAQHVNVVSELMCNLKRRGSSRGKAHLLKPTVRHVAESSCRGGKAEFKAGDTMEDEGTSSDDGARSPNAPMSSIEASAVIMHRAEAQKLQARKQALDRREFLIERAEENVAAVEAAQASSKHGTASYRRAGGRNRQASSTTTPKASDLPVPGPDANPGEGQLQGSQHEARRCPTSSGRGPSGSADEAEVGSTVLVPDDVQAKLDAMQLDADRRVQDAERRYEELVRELDGRCKSELSAERARAERIGKELTALAAQHGACRNEASQLRDELQARSVDAELADMREALSSAARRGEDAEASLRSRQEALCELTQRERIYEEDFASMRAAHVRNQEQHEHQCAELIASRTRIAAELKAARAAIAANEAASEASLEAERQLHADRVEALEASFHDYSKRTECVLATNAEQLSTVEASKLEALSVVKARHAEAEELCYRLQAAQRQSTKAEDAFQHTEGVLRRKLESTSREYEACRGEAGRLRNELQACNASAEATAIATRRDHDRFQQACSTALRTRQELADMTGTLDIAVRRSEKAEEFACAQQTVLREADHRACKYEENLTVANEARARDRKEDERQYAVLEASSARTVGELNAARAAIADNEAAAAARLEAERQQHAGRVEVLEASLHDYNAQAEVILAANAEQLTTVEAGKLEAMSVAEAKNAEVRDLSRCLQTTEGRLIKAEKAAEDNGALLRSQLESAQEALRAMQAEAMTEKATRRMLDQRCASASQAVLEAQKQADKSLSELEGYRADAQRLIRPAVEEAVADEAWRWKNAVKDSRAEMESAEELAECLRASEAKAVASKADSDARHQQAMRDCAHEATIADETAGKYTAARTALDHEKCESTLARRQVFDLENQLKGARQTISRYEAEATQAKPKIEILETNCRRMTAHMKAQALPISDLEELCKSAMPRLATMEFLPSGSMDYRVRASLVHRLRLQCGDLGFMFKPVPKDAKWLCLTESNATFGPFGEATYFNARQSPVSTWEFTLVTAIGVCDTLSVSWNSGLYAGGEGCEFCVKNTYFQVKKAGTSKSCGRFLRRHQLDSQYLYCDAIGVADAQRIDVIAVGIDTVAIMAIDDDEVEATIHEGSAIPNMLQMYRPNPNLAPILGMRY